MRLEAIGWVATAVFSLSYLLRSGSSLRWVQAIAAVLWIAYGVGIAAKPVIVANLIVALAAVGSAIMRSARHRILP
ncbi:MAG TPA: hypothetical protein VKU01_33425 [Bryobacteraceae bacterium]|nr:hypothetical protein [Bryobacteraceae bacterium]